MLTFHHSNNAFPNVLIVNVNLTGVLKGSDKLVTCFKLTKTWNICLKNENS
jgi:hypothetical protein